MNTYIKGDFQICISVPLNLSLKKKWLMLSFKLPSNKSSVSNDTLISISKQSVHVYCLKFTNTMNDLYINGLAVMWDWSFLDF